MDPMSEYLARAMIEARLASAHESRAGRRIEDERRAERRRERRRHSRAGGTAGPRGPDVGSGGWRRPRRRPSDRRRSSWPRCSRRPPTTSPSRARPPNAACSRRCPRSRRSPHRAPPPRWWTGMAPRPPVCVRSVSCTPTSWRCSVRASTRGSSTSSMAGAGSSVPAAWPDAAAFVGRPMQRAGRQVPVRGCSDVSASGSEAARLPPSALVVQLLGRPRIDVDGAPGYRYRSRKSWALLAFLLLGRAATHTQPARLAPLRRGRRPARGVAVVPGGDPTRARPGGRPGWRPGQDLAARRHHGGRGRAGPRSLERRRPAPGPGRRPARRPRHPARRGLRVVAALRAPSARGRHGVDPARGGAGTPRPWGPRPSARPGRPGCRDEPPGREPPGAADQALPPRRRGRGRPAPVRRLGVGRRSGSSARRPALPSCSRCGRDRGRCARARRPRSRQ